jgi:hypothetical protein
MAVARRPSKFARVLLLDAQHFLVHRAVCSWASCEPDWYQKVALGLSRPLCRYCKREVG